MFLLTDAASRGVQAPLSGTRRGARRPEPRRNINARPVLPGPGTIQPEPELKLSCSAANCLVSINNSDYFHSRGFTLFSSASVFFFVFFLLL